MKEEFTDKPIRTRGLTKLYGSYQALVDLNLEVEEGEIFGFLGPNGAGKTTTIKLLLNLIHPTAGEIWILGEKVAGNQKVKREISYLGENYNLYPYLNPREILELSASIYGGLDLSWGIELLNRYGIPMDRKFNDLSRGMRQIVKLVQALLNKGKLVILDEPTEGLDPVMQNEVLEIIKELSREGRTVFFSSHNLHEVEKIADRAGFIKEGKLLAVRNVRDIPGNEKKIIFVPQRDVGEDELTLPGVTGLEKRGEKYYIYYQENEKELLHTLSSIPYFTLQIEKPDLEDLFIRLVGGEKGADTERDQIQ